MQYPLLMLLVVFCSFGCQSKNPVRTVNITLRNDSTNDLDWVELEWKGPGVPGGILSRGIEKTSVSTEWISVETAKLTFVDAKTRDPYSIDLSLSEINKQVLSGKCNDVTIRILSYSHADAVCDTHPETE
jgi:hypothetical protein